MACWQGWLAAEAGMVNPLAWPGWLWRHARQIEDLFGLQDKTTVALLSLNERLERLESRMAGFATSQSHTIAEAKVVATNASAATASAIVGSTLNDIISRTTMLEARISGRLLPPV